MSKSPVNFDPSSKEKKSNETKRRRVTRACDTCRQKKVKCDGKQPCIHCTVYSFKCTYDEPNIRNKKNIGPPPSSQPSEAVLKVAAAQAAQNENLASTSNNLIIAQQIINALLPKLQVNLFDVNLNFNLDKFQNIIKYEESKSSSFPSCMEEISELMQDPSMVLPAIRRPSVSSSNNENDSSSGCTTMAAQSPREVRLCLPSKEVALELIFTTWQKACVLFRFYHRPSLLEEVDWLYSLDPSNYGDRQQKFLPFLYSILACGSLFSKTPYTTSTLNEHLEDDGFKYFLEARKLIDISNVGDINSIQTIVMMIMYLQCSARLSTCYSYIGIALRSVLKEGLHRNLSIFQNSKRKLDPIEIDTRKRLFYTIYKMDIYINSLLGLPRSLKEDEFDQEFPEELDDENITRDGYLYDKQEGRLSSAGCANHHTKLMLILSHIVKKLYPVKVVNTNNSNPHSDELISSSTSYAPDKIHTKVSELELEMKLWLDNLPPELKPIDPNNNEPNHKIPERFQLANYYLHLAFLNCQIMLYRPFIHFISDNLDNPQNGGASTSDPRSLIRGRNCIKVARMVVKLANKMIDQKLLIGTYWFSMYTIFFSIACLIYYFHFANYNNNGSGYNYAGVLFDDDLNIDMIKQDIEIGKKVLDCLKNSSNSSLRIYNILNTLFEQLNRRTASRSRNKSNSNTTTDAPPSHPILPEAQTQAINMKSKNVQSTFKNFNKINQFANGKERENSNIEELFDATNLANFQSGSEIPNNLPKLSEVSNREVEQNNEEIGEIAGGDLTANYMPGVFDKLDAQIFGKILPPYMLEKNDNNQIPQLSDSINSNNFNNNNSLYEDGINLEDIFGLNNSNEDGEKEGTLNNMSNNPIDDNAGNKDGGDAKVNSLNYLHFY